MLSTFCPSVTYTRKGNALPVVANSLRVLAVFLVIGAVSDFVPRWPKIAFGSSNEARVFYTRFTPAGSCF